MKFNYTLHCLIISVILCILTPFACLNAFASNKDDFPRKNFEEFLKTPQDAHDDDTCDDQDVCNGVVTNDHHFLLPYYFVSRADKEVSIRDYPWTGEYDGVASNTVLKVEPNKTLTIDGIVRNQNNKLWLHVKNKGYVYIENVFYDYDANLMSFYQFVTDDTDNALLYFYDCVRPDSYGDIKRWLDPSAKGTMYNVSFNNYCAQLTAEELGNLNYGSLGTLLEIDEETLLYAGGAVNLYGNMWDMIKSPIEYISYCIGSYCDTPEDAKSVQEGINYIKNY